MTLKMKLCIAVGCLLTAIALWFAYCVDTSIRECELTVQTALPTQSSTAAPQSPIIAQAFSDVKTLHDSQLLYEPTLTAEPNQTNKPIAVNTDVLGDSRVDMSVMIETARKTCTYDVMLDVDEDTLRTDLGHLPSSAMPGEDGLCVIMGHRDAQFSILQYCDIDDVITVKSDNDCFDYTVYDIAIIDSDRDLGFDAINEKGLALVTCYPFHYTGHAPQKLIVYCSLKHSGNN